MHQNHVLPEHSSNWLLEPTPGVPALHTVTYQVTWDSQYAVSQLYTGLLSPGYRTACPTSAGFGQTNRVS